MITNFFEQFQQYHDCLQKYSLGVQYEHMLYKCGTDNLDYAKICAAAYFPSTLQQVYSHRSSSGKGNWVSIWTWDVTVGCLFLPPIGHRLTTFCWLMVMFGEFTLRMPGKDWAKQPCCNNHEPLSSRKSYRTPVRLIKSIRYRVNLPSVTINQKFEYSAVICIGLKSPKP